MCKTVKHPAPSFPFQVMSLLEPKTIPLFHFSGDKATTPTCPVDMHPNLNPSSGAQSYRLSDAVCSRSAYYNIPFFLEDLGPRFSEWSVNAHEARPGHHTQVSLQKSSPLIVDEFSVVILSHQKSMTITNTSMIIMKLCYRVGKAVKQ